jgi:hypothetical protein
MGGSLRYGREPKRHDQESTKEVGAGPVYHHLTWKDFGLKLLLLDGVSGLEAMKITSFCPSWEDQNYYQGNEKVTQALGSPPKPKCSGCLPSNLGKAPHVLLL